MATKARASSQKRMALPQAPGYLEGEDCCQRDGDTLRASYEPSGAGLPDHSRQGHLLGNDANQLAA